MGKFTLYKEHDFYRPKIEIRDLRALISSV